MTREVLRVVRDILVHAPGGVEHGARNLYHLFHNLYNHEVYRTIRFSSDHKS